jgi:hypothetical protein
MFRLGFEPGTFSIQVTSVTALTTLLGVNVDKSKYMLVSCHQNAGQNHNINIRNAFCANEAELKHLKITVTKEIAFTDKLGILKSGKCLVPIRSEFLPSYMVPNLKT